MIPDIFAVSPNSGTNGSRLGKFQDLEHASVILLLRKKESILHSNAILI